MTLYKQLVLVILTLFMLMFIGTLLVNYHTTRAFLIEQLESHAQDTATSLGVSLSPPMMARDEPTMMSLVDAIFDRGYYKEIAVKNSEERALIERKLNVVVEEVPAWFVEWVDLEAPQASARLMSGWRQAGTVYVQSHPGFAYEQLWRTLTRTLFWFACTALFGVLVGGLVLRSLLKPLKAMEKQAEAVSAFRYEVQETLPKTRELRSVVLAMNRMTQKVKNSFEEQAQSAEQLRVLAYRDQVTGIGNRRYFDAQLQTRLKSGGELRRGALFLIQINDLNGMNNRHGYQAGDALLKEVVSVLEHAIADNDDCMVARLAGADFGLLIPDSGLGDAEKLAATISSDLAQLHGQGFSDSVNVAHIGVALYAGEESEECMVKLLSEADMALRAAQVQGMNAWYHYAASAALPEIHGKQDWKIHINEVVRAGKLVLHVQPVVDAHVPETILHQEVLVRIPGQDNTLLPARMFMPMAEQLDIALQIDRAVLTQVMEYLSRGLMTTPIAVNLSIASLRDPGFADWLFGKLAKIPGDAQRIEFEFSEFMAVRELDRLRDFATRLRKLGHGFGLDHFGRGFSAFGYLQSLRPDYVKIDGSYTEMVTQDRDSQFFLRTLSSVAHSLDITVIVEAVENQEQWAIMKELNVDGVQGYAVGRPQPLD